MLKSMSIDLQEKIREYEQKYQNGSILRSRLSENTSKHHRKKTSEEEAGEHYSAHLNTIGARHEEICELHAEIAEEEELPDSARLDQFMVTEYVRMKNEVTEQQLAHGDDFVTKGKSKGDGETGVRKASTVLATSAQSQRQTWIVQGNLLMQLALAFMNRSDHYHHAELFNIKVNQSRMPGYQGISGTCKVRTMENGKRLIFLMMFSLLRDISSAGSTGFISYYRLTLCSRTTRR